MDLEYDYRASSLRKMELKDNSVEVEFSGHKPQEGDVVAVRIKEKRGNYCDLDLEGGELVELEEGDVVLGVLGNRAGVKGYIGQVPPELEEGDKLYFIGSGGIFGEYESAANELEDPIESEFLGYVRNGKRIYNTKDHGIELSDNIEGEPCVVALVASRMDAGKTTLATELIDRLSQRGYSVGSLKLTGSARERDRVNMYSAGSEVSMDFVDGGLPSTVDDADEVIECAKGLINEAWGRGDLDLIVAEFGAGLISNYRVQDVLRDLDVKEAIESVCGVTLDVAGAYGLKEILDDLNYPVSFISGPITDTTAGKKSIEDYVGIPAYNAFTREEMDDAVDRLEKELL